MKIIIKNTNNLFIINNLVNSNNLAYSQNKSNCNNKNNCNNNINNKIYSKINNHMIKMRREISKNNLTLINININKKIMMIKFRINNNFNNINK